MKIIVSGKHLEKAPETEQYAISKVEKLGKYNAKIEKISVHLVSEQSHRNEAHDFYCEITIDLPGRNLEIVDVERSMDKAIDRAVERVKRMLVRNKERKVSGQHREALRSKAF